MKGLAICLSLGTLYLHSIESRAAEAEPLELGLHVFAPVDRVRERATMVQIEGVIVWDTFACDGKEHELTIAFTARPYSQTHPERPPFTDASISEIKILPPKQYRQLYVRNDSPEGLIALAATKVLRVSVVLAKADSQTEFDNLEYLVIGRNNNVEGSFSVPFCHR